MAKARDKKNLAKTWQLFHIIIGLKIAESKTSA